MAGFYDEYYEQRRRIEVGVTLLFSLVVLVGFCVLAILCFFIIHHVVEHRRVEKKMEVQAQKMEVQAQKIAALENFVKTVTKHLFDKKLEETFGEQQQQQNLTNCLSFK